MPRYFAVGASTDAPLTLTGSADEVQLTVTGHSTQTSAIAVFEDSGGTDMFAFSNVGVLTVGGGDETDIGIIFNGAAQDYYVGESDALDAFVIGIGSGIGTTEAFTIRGGNVFINDDSADMDFRIESNSNANMFFVDGGLDAIGIGAGTFNGALISITPGSNSRSLVTSIGSGIHIAADVMADIGATDPIAIASSVFFGIPTYSDATKVYTAGTTLYIEGAAAVTGGASMTDAYALWVDDGAVRFDDATLSIGGIDYEWPPDNGDAGEQLETNGSGTLTWEADDSLREYKQDLELADPVKALQCVLDAPVYNFHYKPRENKNPDLTTQYTGVVADEAPWAMKHGGRIFNPINAFGYSALAIQALEARIRELEKELRG